ncbi:MAG: type II secretion system protein [Planctomycetes bacterium]|nr:type II secretion system protein [Planctomycetota bacterium]
MSRCRQRAFTRIEGVIVLVIIGVLLGVLAVTLPWMRERVRLEQCVGNLSKMGKGFYTYASESSILYPVAAPNSTHDSTPSPVTYYNMTGRHGGQGTSGDPAGQAPGQYWDQLSTTRNLWLLVKVGHAPPDSFICPSSGDRPDTVRNPATFWDFAARPGDVTADRGWSRTANNETCVSYGYQVPYGSRGEPNTEVDQRMVLAADKGPYGGVSLSNGQVTTPPVSLNDRSAPELWRPFNSPNHGGLLTGKGQCVLFGDTHVEFVGTPVVGVGNDNIYTAWKRRGGNGDPDTRMHGERPGKNVGLDSLTPAENTDSLIYP